MKFAHTVAWALTGSFVVLHRNLHGLIFWGHLSLAVLAWSVVFWLEHRQRGRSGIG